MYRKQGLLLTKEIQETQKDVSSQIESNVNMSLQAIEQYKTLALRYEDTEEKVISSYEAFGKIIAQIETQIKPIFDKLGVVLELQRWLSIQFVDVKSIVFYLAAYLLAIIATTFKQTESSRISLILLITLNYFIESSICWLFTNKNSNVPAQVEVERLFFSFVCICTYIYSFVTYKDYIIDNNKRLGKIQKFMEHEMRIKRHMYGKKIP